MSTNLKIAVQKSGRLLEGSLKLLRECGIRFDKGKDQLKVQANNFPIELYYLRNSDIPQYVHDGVADITIIGENTIVEKEKPLEKILALNFSKCKLSLAIPKGIPYTGLSFFEGKKIATSYPNTLRAWLKKNNMTADIHEISGSVEIAPNIGLADAICDLVSTGSTLFKNGLEEKEIILKSQASLFANKNMPEEVRPIFEKLVFRLKSVLTAQNNKYLLMNAPNNSIDQIINILPGMKSPTVMPLASEGWSSIHTVIQEDRFWEIIDQLKDNGAQGILVIPIEKMIL